MGSKKRSTESVEAEEGGLELPSNDVVLSNKSKKKMKKEKVKDESLAGEEAGPSSTPSSMKPMERRKKRKALDKERHRSTSENEGAKAHEMMGVEPKQDGTYAPVVVSVVGPSSSGILPEFHIGVFKDLGSSDGSVREAAAEKLVTELQQVQKAYERLENKDVIEGGLKLEAEKDDGLNNCAPSLRYAIRRLIRGVSSSREACLINLFFVFAFFFLSIYHGLILRKICCESGSYYLHLSIKMVI